MIYNSEYILGKLNSKLKEDQKIRSEKELLDLLEPRKDEEGNVIADTHLPTEDLLVA